MPPRGPKDERAVLTRWPLKICYQGVCCHGAKWRRWKKTNPDGSMKKFYRFRARKAARAREEIRAFWARREGVIGYVEPSTAPAVSGALSTSSSDTAEDAVAEREYENLLTAGASAEEILEREYENLLTAGASAEEISEWATRREVWDFAPRA